MSWVDVQYFQKPLATIYGHIIGVIRNTLNIPASEPYDGEETTYLFKHA